MNAEKIMAGIEHHAKVSAEACKECPYYDPEHGTQCRKNLMADTTALIEKLQNSIDNLKIMCKDLAHMVEPFKLKEYLDQYNTGEEEESADVKQSPPST